MIGHTELHSFSHHYWGSIDLNTVHIHVWMYFLIITWDYIELYDLHYRDNIFQYTLCSRGSALGNTSPGTVFLGLISGTHPRAENIGNAPDWNHKLKVLAKT